MSRAELDEAEELDAGGPGDLGGHHRQLKSRLTYLNVFDGRCEVNYRHVEEICASCRR
jgi:homocysteine S-methyltransferase